VNEEALRRALAGRYDLAAIIGEGGSALVFGARDLRHGRDVALKVLRPELAASIGHDRFLREVQIAARLNHPHIVPLYDSGVEAGFVYYTMPYVVGGSLRGLIRRAGTLQLAHALAITGQVADAIGYAHAMGVLHRDVKPENILIAGAHAYVVDFGIAKALVTAAGDTLTRTGFAVGTPGYMSPEQAAGVRELDARTDVYGLACVVYEMLVGETPGVWITDAALKVGRFRDASSAHRARLDGLPGRVEQALTRALALRAADRWQEVAAFADALGEAARGPAARYSTAEVRTIVGRAAELEAQRATPEQLFSVGTVERIAAEVEIPLEDVRRAMDELGLVPAAPVPAAPATPAPLPVASTAAIPATVNVERVADVELRGDAFAAMAATLRDALGPGRATVFDGQLTWRTDGTPDTAPSTVEVTVTPRGGKTLVRITEWRWRVRGRIAAGGVGAIAGASFASITGWLVSGGDPRVALLLMLGGLVAGVLVFRRAASVMDSEAETARLNDLADRLIGRPAAPAVLAPPATPPRP
jgi:membrane protein implicated in regulation of membrane protease activity